MPGFKKILVTALITLGAVAVVQRIPQARALLWG